MFHKNLVVVGKRHKNTRTGVTVFFWKQQLFWKTHTGSRDTSFNETKDWCRFSFDCGGFLTPAEHWWNCMTILLHKQYLQFYYYLCNTIVVNHITLQHEALSYLIFYYLVRKWIQFRSVSERLRAWVWSWAKGSKVERLEARWLHVISSNWECLWRMELWIFIWCLTNKKNED